MLDAPRWGNCGLRGLVHSVAEIIEPASRAGLVISKDRSERPARKLFVVSGDRVQSLPKENPPARGFSSPAAWPGNGGSPPLITSTLVSRSRVARKKRF